MESISLKLEKTFLQDIEKVMKRNNYSTKTEFIREAIRDKIKGLGEKAEEKEKRFTSEIKKEARQIPSYI